MPMTKSPIFLHVTLRTRLASTSWVLGSVSGLQLALGAFVLSLRLGQVGLLMWQPSDVAHTTSSADPWSMQAVVDWVSQFPVSKVAR